MMRRLLASNHVPYVPLGWYVLHYVQRVIGYRFSDIAPCNTIRKINCRRCWCMALMMPPCRSRKRNPFTPTAQVTAYAC